MLERHRHTPSALSSRGQTALFKTAPGVRSFATPGPLCKCAAVQSTRVKSVELKQAHG